MSRLRWRTTVVGLINLLANSEKGGEGWGLNNLPIKWRENSWVNSFTGDQIRVMYWEPCGGLHHITTVTTTPCAVNSLEEEAHIYTLFFFLIFPWHCQQLPSRVYFKGKSMQMWSSFFLQFICSIQISDSIQSLTAASLLAMSGHYFWLAM